MIVWAVLTGSAADRVAAQSASRKVTPLPPVGTMLEGPSVAACLRALPDTAGIPIIAYLGLAANDSVPPTLRDQIENFTVDVADAVRRSMGAAGDTLPRLVLWRSRQIRQGSVALVVHRNGAFDWAVDDTVRTSREARQLLLGALEATRNAGGVILWPDSVAGDSARVHVWIEQAALVDGKLRSTETLRPAIPVFGVRIPFVTSAQRAHAVVPEYPYENQVSGWEGVIHMQFVVDTLGRAVESTIRDVWPDGSAPLEPSQTDVYRRFVDAARRSITASTYRPATISGCKTSQVVDEPFVFNIQRHH